MEIPTKELIETNGGGFEKVGGIKDNVATFANIIVIIALF
jgi:hypothetical protein